jgi:pteridine reductase
VATEGAPVALVTAGAKRLGKAIAFKLAELGYDIALHYNSSENDAKKAALHIEELGRRCFLFKRDFSRFPEVETLIPDVVKTMGAPSLLINNASMFIKNKLMSSTPQQYDIDFNIHVKAPMFLTQAFAASCKNGSIINIVDTSITRNGTDYFTYLLSKKTLADLTAMSARELAPNIRVNAIAPGIILPPEGIDRIRFEQLAVENPLKRAAGPTEILLALEYLLNAVQVTGQIMFVDGGDHIDM